MVKMTSEFDWQYPLGTCVSAEQVELGSGTLLPQGPSCNSVATEDKQIIQSKIHNHGSNVDNCNSTSLPKTSSFYVSVSVAHIVGQTRRSSFFASVNAKHVLNTFVK